MLFHGIVDSFELNKDCYWTAAVSYGLFVDIELGQGDVSLLVLGCAKSGVLDVF